MEGYCHACTYPLSSPEYPESARYCKHCTDANGNLHPREVVQAGIAGWMKSWQGPISDDVASRRAAHFMKGLPAWAEE